MSVGAEDSCIADNCERRAEPNRKYCYGHRKQEKLGLPIQALRSYGQSPAEYLQAKAIEFADAKGEGEREFELARKRLFQAALQYARQRQKVPTSPQT